MALSCPALFVVFRLRTSPLSIETFWLAMLLLLIAIVAIVFSLWTLSALMMTYRIDTEGLSISWGFVRQTVPFGCIEGCVPASEFPAPTRADGVVWPGYFVGRTLVEGIGPVLSYATSQKPAELFYVLTSDRAFAVNPEDPELFIAALDHAAQSSADEGGQVRTDYFGPLRLGIWHDPSVILLSIAALAINTSLFAYVLRFYPDLPDLMPLHFNLLGEVDFIGPRQDVLRLPAISLGIFLANFLAAAILHLRERLAAYIVLVVGLLVQAMFWIATTRIVN